MTPIKTKSNSLTNKPLIIAGLVFIAFLAVGLLEMRSHKPVDNSDTATMIFSFSDGKKQTFNGPVLDKMTILEAIMASSQGDGIKVTYYIDNKNNTQLTAINNDLNVQSRKWNFYVNNSMINSQDLNKIYVKAGDVIEARYQ